jgi:hypothetical protein
MSYGQPPQGGGYGPPAGGYGAPPGGFGPPSPGYGPPPGGAAGPGGPRADALSIVALVAGILAVTGGVGTLLFGILCAWCPPCATLGGGVMGVIVAVPAIAGIVCGILGYRRTTQEPELYSGKGMALAGLITSGISLLFVLLAIIGPWIGCGIFTALNPPRDAGPYQPWGYDGGVSADASSAPPFNPNIAPPTADPNAPPPAGGVTACSRVAACCRAFVTEMGQEASTCDAYNDTSMIPEANCQSTIDGYRSGLQALGRTIPADCN